MHKWFSCSLSILIWFMMVGAAQAAGLNDTGITFCGDATTNTADCSAVGADGGTFPRQDARYGRDAQAVKAGGTKGFSFTKIANDGSVLPDSAELGSEPDQWACTRDNVTGLTWEVKTTSDLRSMSHTYTWYNGNSATNGGSVGTASGGNCYQAGRCDTEKFAQDVNATGLCNATDWRMPTVKELEGIADLGRTRPAIDPTYFPNTPRSYFWSGSPYAGHSGNAWNVDFYDGYAFGNNRDSSYAVRLVRGGQ